MLHLPPLDSLRFFEAAARHQSFVMAGKELGVGIDIAVAREQPGHQQAAAMHRIPGTQGRIDGIGILGGIVRLTGSDL